jgi:hypothetical protein
MGKFTQNIEKDYEFDGDNIKVKMKRLSRVNANIINPHIMRITKRTAAAVKAEGEDFDKSTLLSADEMAEYMEASATVLRDSIVSMEGLFIEGNEVRVGSELYEVFLNHVYFTELLVRMVNDLFAESHMKGDDEKKLEEPPEDTSTT